MGSAALQYPCEPSEPEEALPSRSFSVSMLLMTAHSEIAIGSGRYLHIEAGYQFCPSL